MFEHYSWDLRGCGRHGHATYRPDEADLAGRLCVTTPWGPAWRCLRCGDAGVLGYGLLSLTEAVGLALMKRWGEYVAALATSLFLPLEIHELLVKVSVPRVAALVINLFLVAYLVWTKRLFGVRGGHAAYQAEREGASLWGSSGPPSRRTTAVRALGQAPSRFGAISLGSRSPRDAPRRAWPSSPSVGRT